MILQTSSQRLNFRCLSCGCVMDICDAWEQIPHPRCSLPHESVKILKAKNKTKHGQNKIDFGNRENAKCTRTFIKSKIRLESLEGQYRQNSTTSKGMTFSVYYARVNTRRCMLVTKKDWQVRAYVACM